MPSVPQTPFEHAPMRRFLSRSEAAILIGMVMVVSSLFLEWRRQVPDLGAFAATALHIEKLSVSHNGFGAGVATPLTVCAVLCALTLLWEVTEQNRIALGVAAGAGGLACVVVALTRFALLPGMLLGLTGGALLLFGAIDRSACTPSSRAELK
jgi:hypothetical protein